MNEEDGEDGVEHQDEEDDRHGGGRVMKKEHHVNDAYEDTIHAIGIVDEKKDENENKTAERTRPRRTKPQKAKTPI